MVGLYGGISVLPFRPSSPNRPSHAHGSRFIFANSFPPSRPVLAFCLGHQVVAQALGGLVRPRAGPRKHYALQESELLVEPAGSSQCVGVVSAAVESVRRNKEGGGGGRGRVGGQGDRGLPPRMRLLYHHNDEVWSCRPRMPPLYVFIKLKRNSCEIEYFVGSPLCKLCVMLLR